MDHNNHPGAGQGGEITVSSLVNSVGADAEDTNVAIIGLFLQIRINITKVILVLNHAIRCMACAGEKETAVFEQELKEGLKIAAVAGLFILTLAMMIALASNGI